ncbi:MAG: gas vesicle protein GvpG, partial [Planctomyces sp.]
MFIIDNILMAPAKGFLWIVRELQAAAEAEAENEADALTARLSTLYMQLETGAITQEEFDTLETQVFDRLDELKGQGGATDEDSDSDDGDENDEADEDESDDADDDDDSDAGDAEASLDDEP